MQPSRIMRAVRLWSALLLLLCIASLAGGGGGARTDLPSTRTVRKLKAADTAAGSQASLDAAVQRLVQYQQECPAPSIAGQQAVQQLKSGAEAGQQVTSAQECEQQCRELAKCSAWFWCSDSQACLEPHGAEVAPQGCRLTRDPLQPHPPPLAPADVKPAHYRTFVTGYIHRFQPNVDPSYLRQRFHAAPTVAMVTALPPEVKCPRIAWLQRLAVLNKLDYARLHNYTFHVDRLQGHDTEFDVLDRLYKSGIKEDWLLYMSADMVISDATAVIPFARFAGNTSTHFVVAADMTEISDHRNATALTLTGLLLRNGEWGRGLVAHVQTMLQNSTFKQEVKSAFKVWATANDGMNAKNALAYILAREWPEYGEATTLNPGFCISCHWMVVPKLRFFFGTRFDECKALQCNAAKQAAGSAVSECVDIMLRHLAFSSCTFADARDLTALPPALNWQSKQAQLQAKLAVKDKVLRIGEVPAMSGSGGAADSAEECWRRCSRSGKCKIWIWCQMEGGCDDGFDSLTAYPYHSCTLLTHKESAQDTVLDFHDRGPVFSSAVAGYRTGGEVWRIDGRDVKLASPSVALITAVHATPCLAPMGDWLYLLSTHNKQDFAHLHGWEFHLNSHIISPNMNGPYNKVAMLQEVLRSTSRERAEWIVWMDADTMIMDPGFRIPWHRYKGYDFVSWGHRDALEAGDVTNGMNSGMMLLRNTDWTRKFIDHVGQYGHKEMEQLEAQIQAELPKHSIDGFYDQAIIIWILKNHPEYFERIFFEEAYCLNCYWADYPGGHTEDGMVVPFMKHFAGCQMCRAKLDLKVEGPHAMCDVEFSKSYAFGKCELEQRLHLKRGMMCTYDAVKPAVS